MTALVDEAPAWAIPSEGGFPTEEEFQAVCSAIVDTFAHGLEPLFARINVPLNDDTRDVPFPGISYREVGLLAYWSGEILTMCEIAHKDATKLHRVLGDVAGLPIEDGVLASSPLYDIHGNLRYDDHLPVNAYGRPITSSPGGRVEGGASRARPGTKSSGRSTRSSRISNGQFRRGATRTRSVSRRNGRRSP
jgi:hypothetical protein